MAAEEDRYGGSSRGSERSETSRESSSSSNEILKELASTDSGAYNAFNAQLSQKEKFKRRQQTAKQAAREKFTKNSKINTDQAIAKFARNAQIPFDKRYATVYGFRHSSHKGGNPIVIVSYSACVVCDKVVDVASAYPAPYPQPVLNGVTHYNALGQTHYFELQFPNNASLAMQTFVIDVRWQSGTLTRHTVNIAGQESSGSVFSDGSNVFSESRNIENCVGSAATGEITAGLQGDYQFSNYNKISSPGTVAGDAYYLNFITPNTDNTLVRYDDWNASVNATLASNVGYAEGISKGIAFHNTSQTNVYSDMTIGQTDDWHATQTQAGVNVNVPKSWQQSIVGGYVLGPDASVSDMQGFNAIRLQIQEQSYNQLLDLSPAMLNAINVFELTFVIQQAMLNGTNAFQLSDMPTFAGVPDFDNPTIKFLNFANTIGYADNLNTCYTGANIPNLEVCLQQNSPSYFITTSKDCDGNTINASYLDGTWDANFISPPGGTCCAVDCSGFQAAAQSSNATFGTADGSITIDMTDPSLGGANGLGTPFSTGHYTYTISHPSLTITQDAPPTGGNTASISCTTNTTSGTEHQVTVGSADDQITTGMRVTGTGIPTNSFVGQALAGDIGSDASGLTQFELVDINGNQVSATAAGTNTLVFSAGYKHTWGSLLPTTGVLPYQCTVTDDAGCVDTFNVYINENPAVTGCTTSSALNYNALAVIDDNSCAYCDATSGWVQDADGTSILQLFEVLNLTTQPTTNSSATDGEFSVQFLVDPLLLALQLTASFTYEITLYKLSIAGDETSIIGSAVATQTGLASPVHNFTGLAYAHYGAKIKINDGTGSTIEIEECFSWGFGSVQTKVCMDTSADNYNVSVPADLAISNPTLCTYTCPLSFSNISYVVGCWGAQAQFMLESTLGGTIDLQWYVDGSPYTSQNPTTYTIGPNNPMIIQSDQIAHPDPTITMKVEIGFTNAAGVFICLEDISFGTATLPVCGCMDSTAVNYNPAATVDDNSCISCDYGCMDPNALNFNPTATCDDGTCMYPVGGCMDQLAANYNQGATYDDGSCIYYACLDPSAININYDCNGNYVPNANYNDTSCCTYCSDPGILPTIDNVTITNATQNTGCLGNQDGTFSFQVNTYNGTNTFSAIVIGPGNTYAWQAINFTTVSNIHQSGTTIYSTAGTQGTQQSSTAEAALYPGAYYILVEDLETGCTVQHDFSVSMDTSAGCTDPNAVNYDSTAVCDDGSCQYLGCTNPLAINYAPSAIGDDGSCIYDIPVNPCRLDRNVYPKYLDTVRHCLTIKGYDYRRKIASGLADDCSVLNFWKLTLINYVMFNTDPDLACLYNCEDNATPNDAPVVLTCHEQWVQGGPNTGANHDSTASGFATHTTNADTGTEILDPGNFFASASLQWGDVIKMPSGLIWKLGGNFTTGNPTYNPELPQGALSGNWKLCQDLNTYNFSDNTNYIDNFINFARNFCKDCSTDFGAGNIYTGTFGPVSPSNINY